MGARQMARTIVMYLVLPGLVAAQTPAGTIAGTITGTVTLEGDAPLRRFLEPAGEEGCRQVPVMEVSTLVSAGNRVPWAFLWIARGLPEQGPTAEPTPVVLRQVGCGFQPHVVVLRSGQVLTIRNEDGIPHQLKVLSRINPSVELEIPPHGASNELTFPREELMVSLSGSHPSMKGVLWVMDHPFFSVTDGEGRYRIENVPPGIYAVGIGHESFRGLGKLVEVKDGETTHLDFMVTSGTLASTRGP